MLRSPSPPSIWRRVGDGSTDRADDTKSSPHESGEATYFQTNLCERCTSINWDHFPNERGSRFLPQSRPTKTSEEREAARCRICCLLAKIRPPTPKHNGAMMLRHTGGNTFTHKIHFANDYLALQSTIGLTQLDPMRLEVRSWYPQVADFSLVKQWISDCRDGHDAACMPSVEVSLKDLKVIDCSRRVVCIAPHGCHYIALSYLWGASDTSYGDLSGSLPRTIEDAIVVTQSLGSRYLWVDRYCIDQKNKLDKHIQLNQMGEIYASAQVTLIAAAGTDPTYGLPGVATQRPVCYSRFEQVGSTWMVFLPSHAVNEIYHCTWASRAWTFQEGYLSRRRLIFTDRQMVFICQGSISYEAADPDAPDRFDIGPMQDFIKTKGRYSRAGRRLAMGEARGLLREYSRRNFTHESDALDAIVGILNTLTRGYDSHFYIWGVPFIPNLLKDNPQTQSTSDYITGLNWYHLKPGRRRNGFPSWSSLGWVGEIEYAGPEALVPSGLEIGLAVDERYITPFSYIAEGHAKVQSDARVSQLLRITAYMKTLSLTTSPDDGHVTLSVFEDGSYANHDIRWDEEISISSQVSETLGVILNPQPDMPWTCTLMLIVMKRSLHYERVGMFKLWEKESSRKWLETTKKNTIILR